MQEQMKSDLVIGFSYTATLADGVQIVFQSGVPANAPASELIAVVAKVRASIDVEQCYADIRRIEGQLEVAEHQIGNAKANIAHLDKKAEAREHMEGGSSRRVSKSHAEILAEANAREAALTTYERSIEVVQEHRARIEQLRKKANALASAADNSAGVPGGEGAGIH